MHPHSIPRDDSAGTGGAQHRSSRTQTAAPRTAPLHVARSSEQPHYPATSPRPQLPRSAGSSTIKTWSSRPSTPLSGRASKASTTVSSHRDRPASTPVQRSANNSTPRSARDRTAALTPAATATARTRLRSTPLTRKKPLRAERAAEAPPAQPATVPVVNSITYIAPPMPTAPPLSLKRPSTAHTTAPQQSPSSENEKDGGVSVQPSVTSPAPAAHQAGHGVRTGANEPFAGVAVASSRDAADRNKSAPPPTTKEERTTTKSSAPERETGAKAPAAAISSFATKSHRAARVPPSQTRKQPSPSAQRNQKTMEEGEVLARYFLAAHRTGDASAAASSCFPACPPTPHLCQLPPCNDEERRRLFMALSYGSCKDSLWSLHRHVLPFLATHASLVMPVTVAQMRAVLGDDEALASLDTAPPCAACGSSSAIALARFASELCSWFFYVGVLGCDEQLTWTAALGGVPTLLDVVSAPSEAQSNTKTRAASRTTSRSFAQPTPQHNASLASSVAYSSHDVYGPASLPHVLPLRDGKKKQVSPGEDVKDSKHREATVMWQTTRLEQSMEAASSTAASVEFSSVAEVPPFITKDAFVCGCDVLQRLLDERASAMAALRTEEGGHSETQNFLSLLCATLRSTDVYEETDTNQCSTQWKDDVLPPGRVSPAVRASLRRVQFYIRLQNFMRQLCFYQRAREVAPGLCDTQLIEVVLRSRLRMTAAPADVAKTSRKQHPNSREEKEMEILPRQCSWIGRCLLDRGLRHAILRVHPVTARSSPSTATNTTSVAADTLDVLLTLRSREAERVVRSAVDVNFSVALSGQHRECPAPAPASTSDDTSGRHGSLPAAVLQFFPIPRWSPWQQQQQQPPSRTAWNSSPRTDGVTSCLFVTALLVTTALGPLLYCVVRCVELDWLPGWGADGGPLAPRHSVVGILTVDLLTLQRSLSQLGVLALVLLLTRAVGRRRGAAAATLDVQYRLIQSQATRLATVSPAWLYSAWALQRETVVAAAAAHRCKVRLALACRAAEAADGRGSTSRAFLLLVACVVSLSGLFSVAPVTFFPRRSIIVDGVGLVLTMVFTWRSVMLAWRHRQRRLDWWLQRQACFAEGFAHDLLRTIALTDGWATRGAPTEEGPLCFLPPASDLLSTALCVMPLPLLEELATVAYVMQLCQSLDSTTELRARRFPPCDVHHLRDFPMHCFWEQLCGHAAVAYMDGGGNEASAIAVVERVAAACAEAVEEEEEAKGRHAQQSPVELLLQLLLPWAARANVPLSGAAADAYEGGEDAEIWEVLAPVASTSATLWLPDELHVPHAPSSLPQSSSERADGPAEQPIPLDVEPRRMPYLTVPQRRRLVCAAVVFAGFGMEPRCCSSRKSRTRSPAVSTAPAQARGGGDACLTESTLLCLVHLVFGQLSLGLGGRTAESFAGQWREAERRTRAAVDLVQRVIVTMRLCGGIRGASDAAETGWCSILPQLEHVCFA
ncbi:hypothetical protein ABB37_02189 [Leptomonas pyrrhocoris]|uniref:Transmembrane protein n=1 Tax=Leptomonas pyrrhocoris TaxID=157538 RepID=A0A0N0VGR2_LEPPY|nr:hypothetical protein ABB37_02189 [Leptomonas pyrrhocoris]XP_015662521.1 hypothetical protein ABB37_02189 [Leptomonas pyrrhocoris]KPA84081.1 hypothetical protein ABB37_02189 [Leptomonas pyrrhocoris]KPA84082.1 hypothetical protein ABB37_02189 [Leptomonas pyrrhocoris]|eukprot:XP_015662520.1 hypothetical protein ABB37_02189 [Leptomonas pyrrhocoris]